MEVTVLARADAERVRIMVARPSGYEEAGSPNISQLLQSLLTGRKHILLGNGFSIGCDKRFAYPNLFDYACDYACKAGLSERAKGLFDPIGHQQLRRRAQNAGGHYLGSEALWFQRR